MRHIYPDVSNDNLIKSEERLLHFRNNEVFHYRFLQCDQIRTLLQVWSYLLKMLLIKKLHFFSSTIYETLAGSCMQQLKSQHSIIFSIITIHETVVSKHNLHSS